MKQLDVHFVQQVQKEKESVMKLLKNRNEMELKLQSEIIDKNNIIQSLTKKLIQSTQIILQLNAKNATLSKSYSQKVGEKVKAKTAEMKVRESERLEKMQRDHASEVENARQELESLKLQVKEGENYRELYLLEQKKLGEAHAQMQQMTVKNLDLSQQSESLQQMQNIQSELQSRIKQLMEAALQKDNQLSEAAKQHEAAQCKLKQQQART